MFKSQSTITNHEISNPTLRVDLAPGALPPSDCFFCLCFASPLRQVDLLRAFRTGDVHPARWLQQLLEPLWQPRPCCALGWRQSSFSTCSPRALAGWSWADRQRWSSQGGRRPSRSRDTASPLAPSGPGNSKKLRNSRSRFDGTAEYKNIITKIMICISENTAIF